MREKRLTGRLLKAPDDSGQCEVVFATLDVVDKDGDVIPSGQIGEQRAFMSGWQHNHNLPPIGGGDIFERDGQAIARLDFAATERGQEMRQLMMQFPDLFEFSFGFYVASVEWREQTPYLLGLDVFEVSGVYRGAGVDTHLVSVKSQEVMTVTPQQYEELKAEVAALREATKDGDDLDGLDLPDDYEGSKGDYIAEMIDRLLKADAERDAQWDQAKAGRAFARVRKDESEFGGSPVKVLGRSPSAGKMFTASDEYAEVVKSKGRAPVEWTYRFDDTDEWKDFMANVGLKADLSTSGGFPYRMQDRDIPVLFQSLQPLDVVRTEPVSEDQMYFQTWTQSTVVPDSVERAGALPIFNIDMAPSSVRVQKVGGLQRITEEILQDAPRVEAEVNRMIRHHVRRELQSQMFNGTQSDPVVDGDDILGMEGFFTAQNSNTTAVAANSSDNPHRIIRERIVTMREAGANPMAIFCPAAVEDMIFNALAAGNFALTDIARNNNMLTVMGVPIIVTEHAEDNTALLYSDALYCLGMRRELTVEVDPYYEFRNVRGAIRAYLRVAGARENPAAGHRFTAMNNATGTY